MSGSVNLTELRRRAAQGDRGTVEFLRLREQGWFWDCRRHMDGERTSLNRFGYPFASGDVGVPPPP